MYRDPGGGRLLARVRNRRGKNREGQLRRRWRFQRKHLGRRHTQRNRLFHFGQPHFSDNQGRTEDKLQANVDTAEWFWWNHFTFLHWTAIGFNV